MLARLPLKILNMGRDSQQPRHTGNKGRGRQEIEEGVRRGHWKAFMLFIYLKIGFQSAFEFVYVCLSFADCGWRRVFPNALGVGPALFELGF